MLRISRILTTSSKLKEPKTEPTTPPRPPPSRVPPITTAAKTCSSIELPTRGSPEAVCAEMKTPAAP